MSVFGRFLNSIYHYTRWQIFVLFYVCMRFNYLPFSFLMLLIFCRFFCLLSMDRFLFIKNSFQVLIFKNSIRNLFCFKLGWFFVRSDFYFFIFERHVTKSEFQTDSDSIYKYLLFFIILNLVCPFDRSLYCKIFWIFFFI